MTYIRIIVFYYLKDPYCLKIISFKVTFILKLTHDYYVFTKLYNS